jgi:hypothetical protein
MSLQPSETWAHSQPPQCTPSHTDTQASCSQQKPSSGLVSEIFFSGSKLCAQAHFTCVSSTIHNTLRSAPCEGQSRNSHVKHRSSFLLQLKGLQQGHPTDKLPPCAADLGEDYNKCTASNLARVCSKSHLLRCDRFQAPLHKLGVDYGPHLFRLHIFMQSTNKASFHDGSGIWNAFHNRGASFTKFVLDLTTYGEPDRGVIVATPPSSHVSVLYLPAAHKGNLSDLLSGTISFRTKEELGRLSMVIPELPSTSFSAFTLSQRA